MDWLPRAAVWPPRALERPDLAPDEPEHFGPRGCTRQEVPSHSGG